MTDHHAALSETRIGPAPALCVSYAGSGPLVLFLHGIGGGRRNWRGQITHLAGRYLVAAADARGYGESDDYDGPLAMENFSDDVVRLIDHFGAQTAHLVGLSMGGRVALDTWRRFPGRVRRLALADTSAGLRETQDPARIEAFLAARRAPILAGQTPAELAPVLVEQIAGPNIGAAEKKELSETLASLHSESYLKTLEMATRFVNFPEFAAIDVPTLVIAGAEDRIAPPHIATAMAEGIPGARLEIIEEAGHVSNVERPAEFNVCLDRFLEAIG